MFGHNPGQEMGLFRLSVGINAHDITGTAGWSKDSGKKFYGCCLSRAIGTKKTEYLSFV